MSAVAGCLPDKYILANLHNFVESDHSVRPLQPVG